MKKNNFKRNLFLLGVVLLYIFLSFWYPELIKKSIGKTWQMLYRIIPLLGLVLIFMTLTNLYITLGKVEKHLGKKSGWKGWAYASMAGVIISGPAYLLFPLLKELKKSGAKNSLIAVFLYTRNVKIPFLPILIYYFGISYAFFLTFFIFLSSFINGALVGWFSQDE